MLATVGCAKLAVLFRNFGINLLPTGSKGWRNLSLSDILGPFAFSESLLSSLINVEIVCLTTLLNRRFVSGLLSFTVASGADSESLVLGIGRLLLLLLVPGLLPLLLRFRVFDFSSRLAARLIFLPLSEDTS